MDKIVVLLCAPSGKAAFLINGMTLHSAFVLPTKQFGVNLVQLSSDLVNTVREKLSKVQLVIIDESSMVGSATLSRIDTRLRQIKGVNEPFGGVSILAVRNLNQLPPVKDRPVYQVSRHNEMEAFFDVNPLWNEFHFYELTEVMRQRDDLLFINALNNLANDALTNEDLALIKERGVKPDDVPEYAIRLYGTNKNVSMYNEMKIESNTNVLIVSEAENSFSNNSAEHLKQSMNKLLRTRAGDDFRLENKLNFKISIKYMINYNIDIEDGLVNGACGILRLVTFNGQTNKPEIVWLDFQIITNT
ncbi:ATP-dependent DNA helicase PIF1-like [Ctenocephalides felis]|uniref:ATP-dependent DNA helicase PIF1-like n=1 Tax=Ctenocephalides felis TaxID=7515 RepID=UPI000E6E2B08|nr:ATP-dependent DNA helicase PIF1-like [Ctenocephalides felis]